MYSLADICLSMNFPDIIFVFDLPKDLFQQIFHGHNARRAAESVDHPGDSCVRG